MSQLLLDALLLTETCVSEGHHEFPPYNPDTLRSVYHIRNIEVFKLKQVNVTLSFFPGLTFQMISAEMKR